MVAPLRAMRDAAVAGSARSLSSGVGQPAVGTGESKGEGQGEVAPTLVVMGGLHDATYNSDEVFRGSLLPGGGVERYLRAARGPGGFARVVWELATVGRSCNLTLA